MRVAKIAFLTVLYLGGSVVASAQSPNETRESRKEINMTAAHSSAKSRADARRSEDHRAELRIATL